MYVRIPLPRLTSELVSNLIGLAGLLGLVVFAGGLTGNWWWSLGLASVFAVGLSYVAHAGQAVRPVPQPGERPKRAAA